MTLISMFYILKVSIIFNLFIWANNALDIIKISLGNFYEDLLLFQLM